MANSKYDYVRDYEDATDHKLLKGCFIVVRVDGQSFHGVSRDYHFTKPNDKRALDLMAKAAQDIMLEYFPDVVVSYGHSDEFSFVFRKSTKCYNRRMCKFVSLVTSFFTASFIRHWSTYFTSTPLKSNITFDGRCALYPDLPTLLDYLNWRQADCHINNLYNTTFHALTGEYKKITLDEDGVSYSLNDIPAYDTVAKLSTTEAHDKLKGSVSSDKNEILFSTYGVNYNNELPQFRKGTLICLKEQSIPLARKLVTVEDKRRKVNSKGVHLDVFHTDIINGKFWQERPYLTELLTS